MHDRGLARRARLEGTLSKIRRPDRRFTAARESAERRERYLLHTMGGLARPLSRKGFVYFAGGGARRARSQIYADGRLARGPDRASEALTGGETLFRLYVYRSRRSRQPS